MTWVKAALIRCVRTMAEAALATIGTSVIISEVDWTFVLSATLLAGVVSILMALKGLPEVEEVKDDEIQR